MNDFTSYVCETRENREWLPLFTTYDPVEADRWLTHALAQGVEARVREE